jgi:hypothetical protein
MRAALVKKMVRRRRRKWVVRGMGREGIEIFFVDK